MLRTQRAPSAAIPGALFGLGLAAMAAACQPDLDRRAGRLRVRAENVPTGADLVEIRLDARFTITAEVVAATADVRVDSVPAGALTVDVDARQGPAVLASRRVVVVVPEDGEGRVTVDFASVSVDAGGGPISVAFSEEVPVSGADVTNELLVLRAALDPSDLAGFRRDAAGVPAESWMAQAVAVELDDGNRVQVEKLADLFEEQLQVALSATGGGTTVVVAEGRVPADGDDFAVPAVAHDLSPLAGAFAADAVEVVLSGESHKQSTESFAAEVDIQLVIEAGPGG